VKARLFSARALLTSALFLPLALACAAQKAEVQKEPPKAAAPAVEKPPRPKKIVLLDKPITFQDAVEPVLTRVEYEFPLPERPRRCRLVLRYSGVAAALSEDYKMGRFRDKVELNDTFLLDLNTFSQEEDQVVEHTEWISAKLLRAHNKLTFLAGDDLAREGPKKHDSYELRSVIVELDW
jgi:hypothetical protein